MKFTLNWLREHLDTEADLDTICARLTALGLEVDGVHNPAATLAPFTVAHVISAEPHPNADRLRVCMVDTGSGTVQVVCGAPNARAGMKGVFAAAGSHIPGTGLDLKKGVIRGVESNGMLCSEREMGISDDHEGIIDLPADTPVGASFAAIAGLDDPVIDVALTPDRGDCAGVRGIARDLAASGLGRLKADPRMQPVAGGFRSPIVWHRDLLAEGEACPYVVGRYFRGVKNGPSPKWLQDRLHAIGLRPISALVDITNLVTMDLGRPLHVFDADKLAGDVTMRFARPGESLAALNGKTYTLQDGMTVIADANGVAAIGGIIGGEPTGCSDETVNVFLESALFDPGRTARTGRALQIDSDARYRFERGLDPTSADWGAEVGTRLILELCGGEASAVVTAGAMPNWRRTVTLRPGRVMALGGLDVPADRSVAILQALGFEARIEGDVVAAVPPPWRWDVEGEADLVEEVVRVVGYDAVPAVSMPKPAAMPAAVLSDAQRRVSQAKRLLAGRGMLEAVTYSFTDGRLAALFVGDNTPIRLANPISSELDVMRPSILVSLLAAARRNLDRGFDRFALFEVGPAYEALGIEGQRHVAAGLRVGRAGPRHWAEPAANRTARAVDAFDAKADCLATLEAIGAPAANMQVTADAPGCYHPGRSATLRLGKAEIAWFGDLHPRILRQMGIDQPVVAFEIFLDRAPLPKQKATMRPLLQAQPLQPVARDFAFVVDAEVPAEKLVRAARAADKQLIAAVDVFDVYAGEHMAKGKKSVAIAVTLQPQGQTLTDAEIDAVAARVVAQVEKQTGGSLRG
ncbi:MAG: phenylalanine--tRNA ligase subunit beta [Alphaproteobacteria bacterium]